MRPLILSSILPLETLVSIRKQPDSSWLRIVIRGDIDLIAWWRNQRMRLPTLTRMTMSVSPISAMSSEPKRVFSSTEHTITVKRASLDPETIE